MDKSEFENRILELSTVNSKNFIIRINIWMFMYICMTACSRYFIILSYVKLLLMEDNDSLVVQKNL